MFIKALLIAIVVTVIVGIPTYFLSSSANIQLDNSSLPFVLIAVFCISLVSSVLNKIDPGKGRAERPSRASSDYNDSLRESGNVKWFNASKGFGFITRDTGDDIFVHFRSIRGEGHRVLYDGQRVEFAVSEGDKGLQAEDVASAS